jgi:hypothetical protein
MTIAMPMFPPPLAASKDHARASGAPAPRSRKSPAPVLLRDPGTLPRRYGARVRGRCLEPSIADGAVLAFDKTAKIEPGQIVVIWRRPEHVPPGEHQALVKRLMSAPPTVKFPLDEPPQICGGSGEIAQVLFAGYLNPPGRVAIPYDDILAVHACIGALAESARPDLRVASASAPAALIAPLARPCGTIPDGALRRPHDPRIPPLGILSNVPETRSATTLSLDPPQGRSLTRRTIMNALFGSVAAAAVVPTASALPFSPPAEATPVKTDPIFGAIEAHQAAREALWAESEAWPEEDEWESTEPERNAQIAVMTTKPTTAAGIAAVLEYAGSPAYGEKAPYDCVLVDAINSSDDLGEAGENFLDHIAAAVRGLAAEPHPTAVDTSADAIFAVIKEHREAKAALFVACKANDLDFEDCPNKIAADDRVWEASLSLFSTVPTTLAGISALLRYLDLRSGEFSSDSEKSILVTACFDSCMQLLDDDELVEAVHRFPGHLADALTAALRKAA